MPAQYRHNHYVPVWYQKRFIPPNQPNRELFFLDLSPGFFVDSRGTVHPKRAVKKQGPSFCFAQVDLYTVTFSGIDDTRVEQLFFGDIDTKGREAVEYFTNYDHPYDGGGDAFNYLLLYMSTQKFRTPKGFSWLTEIVRNQLRTDDKATVLQAMMNLRQIYSATWAESSWQIADASQSATKFIVSDHPVTVYNKRCGPKSQWCRGHNDPDIRFHGTHTIFPLSLEKVLILTNLSWVRNPYQDPVTLRPHPVLARNTIFNFNKIQVKRNLAEEEVRQINFIIKSRAFRYIAAAKEDWLYPEKHVSKSDWSTYGQGYLLMPDPRAISIGGTVMWGGGKSGPGALDEYGRPPWHPDFEKESKSFQDWKTLQRFQGEFARLFGPFRRGQTFEFGGKEPERDSDEMHAIHLSWEKKYR